MVQTQNRALQSPLTDLSTRPDEPFRKGTPSEPSPFERLRDLLLGALNPPPGRRRIALAVTYGAICHSLFAIAVSGMMVAMFFGMTLGFGRVPEPWSYIANGLLLLQFPLAHSFLLTRKGGSLLGRLAPQSAARTLSTTTYAIVASIQLLLLFGLWTPSGTVWWRADGAALIAICCAYATSWLLLAKSIYDAGVELQSGALGWLSLLQKIKPRFPGMPTGGLFRIIRQPIYVAFALTTWTVPVWTPDQLAVALFLTGYCLLAPIMKERRLQARHGAHFEAYRRQVPYAVPRLPPMRKSAK